MNTGSGLKTEPLNFLTTMHKDEVCMHFRSALAEQMVKRVLRVCLCFTFPLFRATRHYLGTCSTGIPNTVWALPTWYVRVSNENRHLSAKFQVIRCQIGTYGCIGLNKLLKVGVQLKNTQAIHIYRSLSRERSFKNGHLKWET